MKKSTALRTLCKILETTSKTSAECEIAIAREGVKCHINNNMDNYLQLKAETEHEPSATESYGYVFSLLGFAVAALAFLFSVFSVFDKILAALLVSLALIGELSIAICMLNKVKPINKWRKYILAVIDECKPQSSPTGAPQGAPATTLTASPTGTQTQNPASN